MHSYQSYLEVITTDGDGAATVYFGSTITGKVIAIKYDPGDQQIATGADLTITGETSGVPILTKANAGTSVVWYYPRTLVNSRVDGASSTDLFDLIPVFGERIKLVVAQGGATKVGAMTIFVEENEGYWEH